jgi:hypothetical protein
MKMLVIRVTYGQETSHSPVTFYGNCKIALFLWAARDLRILFPADEFKREVNDIFLVTPYVSPCNISSPRAERPGLVSTPASCF